MAVRVQYRKDTITNWSTRDPILALGEPGYEIESGRLKIGDGVSTWNQLPYAMRWQTKETFTPTNGQTTFNLANAALQITSMCVNGLHIDEYLLNGNSLVYVGTDYELSNTDKITVHYY